jgi:hypothetical protein
MERRMVKNIGLELKEAMWDGDRKSKVINK